MDITGRTSQLFAAALAAVGGHVVDDAFLQPQPGTTAGDHLARGLVPLVAVALSVRAFGRARDGARATLALLWSFWAIVMGAEAIYYAGHGDLTGDDYTGLMAVAAAAVLLVIGVATLWRSRRLGDRLVWRYLRRASLGAGLVVGLSLALLPFAVSWVGGQVSRAEIPVAHLGADREDVALHTADGLRLEGWYVPSRNGAAIVLFPGRKGPLGRARMLVRRGYGVLLFDRRGEGKSEGDPDGFGWNFDKDIQAAVAFLKARPDVDPARIGGIGLSVGGEMMLQAASESPDLAAVVAEGAGARTASEELDDASGLEKLGAYLAYGVRDLTQAVVQGSTPPTNLKRLVPKISPRAVFFIHAGPRDVGQLGPAYYRAAGQPKRIWEANGGHTQAFAEEPREYERRVTEFFGEALR